MDEIEDYSEKIHEQSNEHAHEILHHSESKDKWVMYVALSTAVIAVLAAITGLLAGNHADDAMLTQIHASDQWAFYQSKGIKAELLASTDHVLVVMGKQSDTVDNKKIAKYKQQQQDIMKKATEYQKESDTHVERHDVLARGVTLFQASIAIGAISIITRRRPLWFVSLGFAGVGLFFLIQELFF
jgi:hypothetical protein